MMPAVPSMTGKTVLVTGGTGGIGMAAAIGLASMGARVGITGRGRARAEQAAAAIVRESGNPAVDVFVADMSSQAEVRRLAAEVLSRYPRLDVLLNNVGGFWAHRRMTADGLEHTFALNHLAPFLLTSLRLEWLMTSAPARVVTVSSGAHTTGKLDFGDLMGQRKYSAQRAYSQSKLANVMFTYELARRLVGTGVTATVLHPGVTRTHFGAEDQAGDAAARAPVPQNSRRWCGYPDLPRVLRRGRRGHWSVFRQAQTESLEQGILRHRRGGPTLARERRSCRPPARPDSSGPQIRRRGAHFSACHQQRWSLSE